MADQDGVISSILYGPDSRTQITPATRNVLFTVYAPNGISREVIESHLEDIRDSVLLVSPRQSLIRCWLSPNKNLAGNY